jgi:hypothetical protein
VKPCKIIVTVEVEVTNAKDVLAEGRKVAIGTKPTTRKTALMEVLHDRIDAAPGLMLSGMKATCVDWFEFDAVLDPRHPQYDGPREKTRHPRSTRAHR